MKNPLQFNFKFRFHLGKGENFMHWRIEDMNTGRVTFEDPKKVQFTLMGCFLRNQKGAANKIHSGGNKTVCAWIECESYIPMPLAGEAKYGKKVAYNPRVAPYWHIGGENVDGKTFETLVTQDNQVLIPINTVDDMFSTYEKQWLNQMIDENDELENAEYQKYI